MRVSLLTLDLPGSHSASGSHQAILRLSTTAGGFSLPLDYFWAALWYPRRRMGFSFCPYADLNSYMSGKLTFELLVTFWWSVRTLFNY